MFRFRNFLILGAIVSGACNAEAADMAGDILRGVQTPWNPAPVAAISDTSITLGTRVWYSSGKFTKNLYDLPAYSSNVVSRLTYDKLTAGSGEVYGRIDAHGEVFVKGYAGLGRITSGKLKDEDFPPFIAPYSSTTSDQKHGDLRYGSIDVGYTVFNNGMVSLGAFGGYHILNENVNAYGCTQDATNPFVCVPGAVGPGDRGIRQETLWQSARLGLEGKATLYDRLTLTAEAAWVPYTQFHGTDTHYYTLGATSERGHGDGYQLEATGSYALTDAFSLGAGVRYWHMTAKPTADFGGDIRQPEKVTTERFGVFGQASYKFGI